MTGVTVVPKQGAHGQSNGGAVSGTSTGSNSVAISDFPTKVQALLQEVDSTGDGLLQVDELHQIFDAYRNLVAQQREKSLDIGHMPKEFQEICQPFDVNGNGKVEAFELAHAADLYTKEKAKSRSYLRVVMLLGLLLVVLLGCSMALTFAVVELSKESKVSEDGVMTVAGDSTKVVKVKSADSFVNKNGEMRNEAGKEITMPSKTTNVALRYSCPAALFQRMKEISVSEPAFVAIAKVVGVYKTSLELVVATDLFKVRVRKDGNTLIQPLEDDLISPTELLPEFPTEGSGSRRRLQGTDRGLLQATSGVGVSLADELGFTAGVNGEDSGSSGGYKYVITHRDSKCKNRHMLIDNSFTGDADACVAKVVEGVENGSCAEDPTVFGYRITGEDSGADCYCVAPDEDCMPESSKSGYLKDGNGNVWDARLVPEEFESKADYDEFFGGSEPVFFLGGDDGWSVYFLDHLTSTQTQVFDEWAANNIAVTQSTPVPEDPRIKLVATGKVCMNVKKLHRPSSQSEFDFFTVDECMRLAFEDPDCLAHGPTIQFHDYTNQKPQLLSANYHEFSDFDCACSYQCDYDTVVENSIFKYSLMNGVIVNEEQARASGEFRIMQRKGLFIKRGDKRCRGEVFGLNPPNDDTYPYIARTPHGVMRTTPKGFIDTGDLYWDDWDAWYCSDNGQNSLRGSQGCVEPEDHEVYVFPWKQYDAEEPAIPVPQGHCLDTQFQYNMTEDDMNYLAEYKKGNTNIYTWKPAVPPDPCTLVNVGSSNVDGSGFAQVQIPAGGYVCPTTIDSTNGAFDEDVFHLVQFQDESVVSSASISPAVSYVAAFKSDGARSWEYELQFSCCIPPTTARATTGSAPQQVTAVVGTNPESSEFVEVKIQPGYTCPSVVNNTHWVGGYTLEYEFVVKQVGTTLRIKNPWGCNYGWEGMFLMFPCERGVAPTPALEAESCAVITAGELSAPVMGELGEHIFLGAPADCEQVHTTSTQDMLGCLAVASEYNAAYFSFSLLSRSCLLYTGTCTEADSRPYYTYSIGGAMTYDYYHLGKFQRPCDGEGTVVGGGDPSSWYSLDGCEKACNAHNECNTFMHNPDNGGCLLKRLDDPCNHGGICTVSEEGYDGYEQYMTWGGCYKKIFTASVVSNQTECPSVVDSSNWVVPPHQQDATMMDHTFALARIGDVDGKPAFLVERTDSSSAAGWAYELGIQCCPPQPEQACLNVRVGSSMDHAGHRVHVDAGYTCPATVTKHNWEGGFPYNDKFHIIQEAKGVGSAPGYVEGSELSAVRSDAPGAGWGMNLEFQCCQQSDCVKVHVGNNDDPTQSRTWTVPEGYVCPEKVTKTNWMGGWTFDDAFTVVQDGESIRVMRDICITREWGLELEFECCKPVAQRRTTCTCSTPGARVYTCSDNTVGYCAMNEECYATDEVIKGDLANLCR